EDRRELFESRREMTEHRSLVGHPEPGDGVSLAVELTNRFRHIGDLHVRVDPAGDRQPDHLKLGMNRPASGRLLLPEHHRPDLYPTDAVLAIEGHSQGLSRKFLCTDMREKFLGVEIDRMPTDRLEDRHAPI